MDLKRWINKVAIVTGASSGIGAAIAADLTRARVKVVALDIRENRLQKNKESFPENLRTNYYPFKCDVTNESEVKKIFQWVEENLGGTDILINNAGVGRPQVTLIEPDNTKPMREILETNVMAAVYCVREAFNSMKRRNVDGHVVLINSIGGHKLLSVPGMSVNMYCPSKFAITAMTEVYRQEFANAGTKVKITSISPGMVDTEMLEDRSLIEKLGCILNPEDVSNAVLYCLSTPPHVQIHDLMIKPIGEKI